MQGLNFWKDWPRLQKATYLIGLFFFLGSILFCAYAYLMGRDRAFPWIIYGEMSQLPLSFGHFSSGIFSMGYLVDNYLIKEWFTAGQVHLSPALDYTYGLLTFLLVILILGLITTFSRRAYIVGMVFIILFLMLLQTEIVLLFGLTNKTPLIIAFSLLLPLSYFFHALRPEVKLFKRLVAFGVTGAIFLGIIHYYGQASLPLLHLVHYGIMAPYLLAMIFILLVGHEVLAGVMVLVTYANNEYSKNSSIHFFVVAAIYIAQVTLMYLDRTTSIHIEVIPIHPYILLSLSALLGIWGFGQRENQYQAFFTFSTAGAGLYLALGLNCFLTISYLLLTANDPLLFIIEEMIVYVHLAFALAFIFYVLANFMSPLAQNLKVYRILYKPENMPYTAFRLSAVVMTIIFVLKENIEVPFAHSLSGYYNSIADLHTMTQEDLLKETYYRQGRDQGYQNHRSNYALAKINQDKGNDIKAVYHYDMGLKKRPTPQAFVNLSQVYLDQGRFFEGLFILKDGLTKFPENGRIKNNLGLLYGKVGEEDSTFLILSAAASQTGSQENARANYLALMAEKNRKSDLSAITSTYQDLKSPSNRANLMALYNQSQYFDENSHVTSPDSLLTYPSFSSLYNSTFNKLYGNKIIDTQQLLDYARYEGNAAFREKLRFLAALSHYHNDEVRDAFRLMDQLAYTSSQKGAYYYNILGLWALEQNAPELAVSFFEKAVDGGSLEAQLNRAIALSTAKEEEKAEEAWKSLSEHPSLSEGLYKKITGTYHRNIENPKTLNDEDKYLYWHYRLDTRDSTQVMEWAKAFENENLRWKCLSNLIRKKLKDNQTEEAERYWNMITPVAYGTNDTELQKELYELKKEMWVYHGQWDALKKEFSVMGQKEGNLQKSSEIYHKALIAVHENDTASATQYFQQIAYKNPFYEQAVIGAAHYFHKKNPLKAYEILVEAIELNPNAITLLQAYVLQCARLGFNNYAEPILEKLEKSIPEKSYKTFSEAYLQKLKETEMEAD